MDRDKMHRWTSMVCLILLWALVLPLYFIQHNGFMKLWIISVSTIIFIVALGFSSGLSGIFERSGIIRRKARCISITILVLQAIAYLAMFYSPSGTLPWR